MTEPYTESERFLKQKLENNEEDKKYSCMWLFWLW